MYREPTVTGRKPGLKSMVWSRQKKETFNQNRMKKQEFKTMRRRLGTFRSLRRGFKHSNIQIIGSQKEKRKTKTLKTYLNK